MKKAAATAPCLIPSSRGTSGLLQIAKLLENHGVCGIPTDTVYALAASCKNPSAIEKIYNIKVSTIWFLIYIWCAETFLNTIALNFTSQERPAEKPICICISSLEQLVAANPPFSPLLWEFMKNVYPGGISCIVFKEKWLLKLGKRATMGYVIKCFWVICEELLFFKVWGMHTIAWGQRTA